MAERKCTVCGLSKPLEDFPKHSTCSEGHSRTCKICRLAWQRQHRSATGNKNTKRYEKTPRGYLMRTYRNMESRVTGIQWRKAHLYQGKELLPRDDFYTWARADEVFNALFASYAAAGWPMRLAPSIDRIDSSRGYELDNMRWLTHSENSANLDRKKPRR